MMVTSCDGGHRDRVQTPVVLKGAIPTGCPFTVTVEPSINQPPLPCFPVVRVLGLADVTDWPGDKGLSQQGGLVTASAGGWITPESCQVCTELVAV